MSPQRRTFPPRATGRPSDDDEYPTDTFELVADRADHDAEPSRAEPTLGSVAASDDDPPTQVFGVISDAADPPAVAVQLFGEYSGSDDEHDTGVIARVCDDDIDFGVAGPSGGKFRACAAASDDARTEQFAAYRDEDEVAPQGLVLPVPAGSNGRSVTGRSGLPQAAFPDLEGDVRDRSAGTGRDRPEHDGSQLDTSEQDTSEHAPEITPAADETLAPEPVLDKKAAKHAAKDQKAAAREAAKAERLAARAERKAERLAARAERKAAKRPADAATGRPDVATGPDVEAGMDAAAPATEDAAAVDTTASAGSEVASDSADPDASDSADPDASDSADPDLPASAAQPTASVGSEVGSELGAVAGPAAEFESVADAGTGAAAKAETGSEIEADDARIAGRRRAQVLIVALLLIAAAGGGAAWLFRDQAVKAAQQHPTTNIALLDKSATAEVIEQVSGAVEAIYSYDAGSLDQSEAQALALISGSYASEFKQNFAAVRALPPQQRASLSSKVVAAGVITLTERRASLLVMVDQVGRQGDKPEPVNAAVRLSVTAQRVDGQWKVSGVNQK